MDEVSEYIDKEAFISEKRKQFCENCERRKGIKHGKKCFIYEIGCSLCRACDIGDMIDAVEDFPAADVAPVVHGRWEYNKFYIPECSNCGACPWRGYIPSLDGVNQVYKFCPCCGARMDESNDEEQDEPEYDRDGRPVVEI